MSELLRTYTELAVRTFALAAAHRGIQFTEDRVNASQDLLSAVIERRWRKLQEELLAPVRDNRVLVEGLSGWIGRAIEADAKLAAYEALGLVDSTVSLAPAAE